MALAQARRGPGTGRRQGSARTSPNGDRRSWLREERFSEVAGPQRSDRTVRRLPQLSTPSLASEASEAVDAPTPRLSPRSRSWRTDTSGDGDATGTSRALLRVILIVFSFQRRMFCGDKTSTPMQMYAAIIAGSVSSCAMLHLLSICSCDGFRH